MQIEVTTLQCIAIVDYLAMELVVLIVVSFEKKKTENRVKKICLDDKRI